MKNLMRNKIGIYNNSINNLNQHNSNKRLEKVIGVDYGRKFTGLAISTGGLAPRALKVLKTEYPWTGTASKIVDVAVEMKVDGIIIGIPVSLDGDISDKLTDSKQGRFCRNFGKCILQFARNYNLRVFLFNESNTTKLAMIDLTEDEFNKNNYELWSNLEYYQISHKKQKKSKRRNLDAKSAAILLKHYFEYPNEAYEIK